MNQRAISLPEILLIIIMILIFIVVLIPTYRSYAIRRNISYAKVDMLNIGVALENYYIDYNSYPPDRQALGIDDSRKIYQPLLTTPYPYIESLPKDIFSSQEQKEREEYTVYTQDEQGGYGFPRRDAIIWSNGPDNKEQMSQEDYENANWDMADPFVSKRYDPTNGAQSSGDIILHINDPDSPFTIPQQFR